MVGLAILIIVAILAYMLTPEITPYGDNFDGTPASYSGMMYRFPGAEHISVERSAASVHVSLSTTHDATYVKENYERIFGTKAVIGPWADDEIEDEEFNVSHERQNTAAMSLGPICMMIVDTDDFSLGLYESNQVFHDRPEETATVFMRQQAPEVDFRHKALLSAVADKNVREHLDAILPD